MKTVTMTADFDYRPKVGVIIAYIGGQTYQRVPEAAVAAIVKAEAGTIHVKDRTKKATPGQAGGAPG